jgi:hypothetical protein
MRKQPKAKAEIVAVFHTLGSVQMGRMKQTLRLYPSEGADYFLCSTEFADVHISNFCLPYSQARGLLNSPHFTLTDYGREYTEALRLKPAGRQMDISDLGRAL